MSKAYAAPGGLELVRVFVNSLDLHRIEADPLASAAGACAWLTEAGFRVGALSEEEAAEVREIREVLRRELLAHTDKAGCEERETWTALATTLAGSGLEVVFEAPGKLRLEPGRAGVAGLRSLLAARIYDAVRGGEWRRLKACRNASCQFAFYDRSKNGSGAWCDMALCGNRVKARRRRARTRTS